MLRNKILSRLMKTINTWLFLELNFSAFLAQCFSLGQARCFQVRQGRLVQLGQVRLKTRAKIDTQKSPCITCLHLPQNFNQCNVKNISQEQSHDTSQKKITRLPYDRYLQKFFPISCFIFYPKLSITFCHKTLKTSDIFNSLDLCLILQVCPKIATVWEHLKESHPRVFQVLKI